jgi:hypothetical protein
MGSFETSDRHTNPAHQPIRVPIRKDELFQSAKEMVDDLSGWDVQSEDADALVLECVKQGGVLGGTSRITITVEGPDGIPSATVNVRSETDGGLLSRDKSVVAEFVKPFHRRVC